MGERLKAGVSIRISKDKMINRSEGAQKDPARCYATKKGSEYI